MGRIDPPHAADERTMVVAFLDYQRASMCMKIDGLTEEQARWRPAPTANSLIGMINHLGYVERWWFQRIFAGADVSFPWTKDDHDADFRVPDDQTVAETIAFYRDGWERSNEIALAADLDAVAATTRPGREGVTMRWILHHMVEETARHAGHADITRELIDGSTGE